MDDDLCATDARSLIDAAADVGPFELGVPHARLPVSQLRAAPGVRDLGVFVVRQRAGVLPGRDGVACDHLGPRQRARRRSRLGPVSLVCQSTCGRMQLAGQGEVRCERPPYDTDSRWI